jgi:tRNA-splicing endonuclease subunit Sen2
MSTDNSIGSHTALDEMNGSPHSNGTSKKPEKKVRIASPPPRTKPEKTVEKRRPNFAHIHSKPLPIETYPIPAFIPHNPLSILHIAWTVLSHYFYPANSHTTIYNGYWSPHTRSIHVTDPKHMRALWEMGFFGKGSLSRSEPTWLDQERKRLGLTTQETSEGATNKRRKEREMLKRERAKAERAIVEDQRRKEAEGIRNGKTGTNDVSTTTENGSSLNDLQPFSVRSAKLELEKNGRVIGQANKLELIKPENHATVAEPDNQEHLQISPEEAFFLSYGLGALRVLDSNNQPMDNLNLWKVCRQNSYFPPISLNELSPDDPFLIHYTVYHHFRSLGWVVRDGIKFSVDYLLYERGPVFKHAAFAVVIVPSYTDTYWSRQPERTKTQRRKSSRDWSWLHCVNRVQAQVVKTLVLAYVDIPPPSKIQGDDIGVIMRSYKVREFCISRWSPNRNRD